MPKIEEAIEMLQCAELNCDNAKKVGGGLLDVVKMQIGEAIKLLTEDGLVYEAVATSDLSVDSPDERDLTVHEEGDLMAILRGPEPADTIEYWQNRSAELLVEVAQLTEQRDLWIARAAEWQHKAGASLSISVEPKAPAHVEAGSRPSAPSAEPPVLKRTLDDKVNEIRSLVGAIHTKLFAGEEALAELLAIAPKSGSVDLQDAAREWLKDKDSLYRDTEIERLASFAAHILEKKRKA